MKLGSKKSEPIGSLAVASGSAPIIDVERGVVSMGEHKSFVAKATARAWQAMQLKSDLFDYLCLASDGTTCWGKTYAEAVRVAMEHDKEIYDETKCVMTSPNVKGEPTAHQTQPKREGL